MYAMANKQLCFYFTGDLVKEDYSSGFAVMEKPSSVEHDFGYRIFESGSLVDIAERLRQSFSGVVRWSLGRWHLWEVGRRFFRHLPIEFQG
jgi:hypothetical protein